MVPAMPAGSSMPMDSVIGQVRVRLLGRRWDGRGDVRGVDGDERSWRCADFREERSRPGAILASPHGAAGGDRTGLSGIRTGRCGGIEKSVIRPSSVLLSPHTEWRKTESG
jgi:hypothetical protein